MADAAYSLEGPDKGSELVTLSRAQLRRLHRMSLERVPVAKATAEFDRLVDELDESSRVVNTEPRPTDKDRAEAAILMRRRKRKVRKR